MEKKANKPEDESYVLVQGTENAGECLSEEEDGWVEVEREEEEEQVEGVQSRNANILKPIGVQLTGFQEFLNDEVEQNRNTPAQKKRWFVEFVRYATFVVDERDPPTCSLTELCSWSHVNRYLRTREKSNQRWVSVSLLEKVPGGWV